LGKRAIHYWIGSHRKGVLAHNASHVLGFSQGLGPGEQDSWGEETVCCVKQGDCLIHHSVMIHSAGPNLSPRMRRALGLVYFAERAEVDPAAQRRYQESVAMQQKSLLQERVELCLFFRNSQRVDTLGNAPGRENSGARTRFLALRVKPNQSPAQPLGRTPQAVFK